MVHVAMQQDNGSAPAPSTDSCRASARDQCPNQRARRMAPNCSFSAAYSSAGS